MLTCYALRREPGADAEQTDWSPGLRRPLDRRIRRGLNRSTVRSKSTCESVTHTVAMGWVVATNGTYGLTLVECMIARGTLRELTL